MYWTSNESSSIHFFTVRATAKNIASKFSNFLNSSELVEANKIDLKQVMWSTQFLKCDIEEEGIFRCLPHCTAIVGAFSYFCFHGQKCTDYSLLKKFY